MAKDVAIVGAGVSGLTTAVVFAEHGYNVSIFAEETGQQTTSAAAAAMWFPYDAEPAAKVIPWALATYKVLADLANDPRAGVSMIGLRQYSRAGELQIHDWAIQLGASAVGEADSFPHKFGEFANGFSLNVPLTDTTIYLDYLRDRLMNAGGMIHTGVRFEKLEDVDCKFDLVINCAGFGAKALVHDADLEPHRGQVAIVPKIDNLECAIVCDDAPLMYAIPRKNDCVFGGTNEISEDRRIDPASTSRIVSECSRVLKIENPKILAEKVGLRPFRKSGVRVDLEKLSDGRTVIHNYGHGGAGFTLSWGCATEAFNLAGAGSI
jgi:D-amino-acid oxidase